MYIKSDRPGPVKEQWGHPCLEPQEFLNEYFSFVFTMEKMMKAREFRRKNSDVLQHIAIMN